MDDSKDRTLWVGNVSEDVSEQLLYELFLQAGPLEKVSIPKDKASGKQKSFAFITFKHEMSVPFCINIFDGIHLFRRRLQLKTRNGSVHTSGKNPVDPDKWGIGLLPHPSKGCGLIKPRNIPDNKMSDSHDIRNGHGYDSPSQNDYDNNNSRDEYDTRRVVMANSGHLMPPPGPPMGPPARSNVNMPAQKLGYQGQNPAPRNFHRSQTWHGVVDLTEDNVSSDNQDSRRTKQKYEDRFSDRDSRDIKRRRFDERYSDDRHSDRHDDRHVVHDNDHHSRSRRSSSYERQRSFDRNNDDQMRQMGQMQMQMLQQQQMQNVRSHSFGGRASQYPGNGGYRRY